jgi:hypothetical protein
MHDSPCSKPPSTKRSRLPADPPGYARHGPVGRRTARRPGVTPTVEPTPYAQALLATPAGSAYFPAIQKRHVFGSAAIAQLVRALDCGSRGPLFKPGWRYQIFVTVKEQFARRRLARAAKVRGGASSRVDKGLNVEGIKTSFALESRRRPFGRPFCSGLALPGHAHVAMTSPA